MNGRRYLAGAHLLPDSDADIYTWAQQLARDGRLSQAVKDGLRLIQYLCTLPEAGDLQRRGILVEAVKAGLLPIPPATSPHHSPDSQPRQPAALGHSPRPPGPLREEDVVGQALDRMLGLE